MFLLDLLWHIPIALPFQSTKFDDQLSVIMSDQAWSPITRYPTVFTDPDQVDFPFLGQLVVYTMADCLEGLMQAWRGDMKCRASSVLCASLWNPATAQHTFLSVFVSLQLHLHTGMRVLMHPHRSFKESSWHTYFGFQMPKSPHCCVFMIIARNLSDWSRCGTYSLIGKSLQTPRISVSLEIVGATKHLLQEPQNNWWTIQNPHESCIVIMCTCINLCVYSFALYKYCLRVSIVCQVADVCLSCLLWTRHGSQRQDPFVNVNIIGSFFPLCCTYMYTSVCVC